MIIRNTVDLANSNCNRRKRYIEKIIKKAVTVGIHKKDKRRYPNSDVTTAEVGVYNEYGTSKAPARVWLRIFNLMTKEKKDLKKVIHASIKENDNPKDTLEEIGSYQKERVQDRIRYNEVTPHSHNKSGITLIDTGQLVNSINYEVRNV